MSKRLHKKFRRSIGFKTKSSAKKYGKDNAYNYHYRIRKQKHKTGKRTEYVVYFKNK
jgi:hypothetical protein